MADGEVRKTSIALTPVSDGRFEVYLDGEKVYDRKEPKEDDFVPALKVLRKKVGLELMDKHEAAAASSEAAAVPS